MGKYGRCAAEAVDRVRNRGEDPVTAWKNSARAVFPHSDWSQKKGCPKDAFLGLCEAGIVEGIPRGQYTRSLLNKKYALDAVEFLKENPTLSRDENALWQRVQGNDDKAHNAQMDVVIALWTIGLIGH
jgi:hypothetical protein